MELGTKELLWVLAWFAGLVATGIWFPSVSMFWDSFTDAWYSTAPEQQNTNKLLLAIVFVIVPILNWLTCLLIAFQGLFFGEYDEKGR